jgi:mono/diheme cytochrome c family protein
MKPGPPTPPRPRAPFPARLWAGGFPLWAALAFGPGPVGARAGEPERVDFARDVLPILSDNCFQCHGPDPKTRKADLRLDTKDGALREADPIVVPGKSDESELIRRITSENRSEVMPPPRSNRKLTPAQVETLRRWVDQGAKWGIHWAFAPPRRPEPPRVRHDEWARNAIDRFVLARLEREGLAPSAVATKEALIRRVTLDLTGLPPSQGDVDAFLADGGPDAYERLVDRLLASPRYGERMATEWLDLARFADTHGYQMDRERPMWPWRDWVIRALNRNQPFDQFVTWQLAGDLLPDATKEQRLATAFNRLHNQNEEGGIVEEEYRVAYVVDRVNTMATAFLGLTLECARCHDHKFDPITQRDFYSLFAFFQNIDESGQTTYFTSAMPVPTLLLSDDATDGKLADLDRRIADKERELQQRREQAGADFERWLSGRSGKPEVPGLVGAFDFDEAAGGKATNAADPRKPALAHEGPGLAPGRRGKAAELDGEDGFTFPGLGHFTRVDPFSISLWVRAPSLAPRSVLIHHSRAPIDAGSRGYEVLLEDGRVAFGLHHMWPGNSLKVRTGPSVPAGEWVHVAVTYDGSSRASGVRIYLDGVAAPLEVVRDGLFKDITYEGGEPDLALGYRFRDSGFKGGRVDDLRLFDRRLTPLEAAHLAGRSDLVEAWDTPASSLTAAQRSGLLDYLLATTDEAARRLAAELHDLRQQQSRLINPIPEAMVMKELPSPKPAFVLRRGAYDAPGEPVTADTPAALPPFPADQPRDRLGLARWLLSPGHPLTARVTVNRLWQMMFGTGIVETSDNFGRQGAQPSHPELLDWLACEFVESGWDLKRMLRLLATSATYRQSSRAGPDLLARDPANRLLARGPARRLTAEMLRDQALATSGLLAERPGGPSVRPYQPEGNWDVAMGRPRYDQSHGADLHRRSLYTFWKRTVPPPAMIAFDAAERNVCTVRRQSTSTPLQALTLLNDPQIVEAARHLSQRMLREGGDGDAARVSWMFRQVTGRRPRAEEVPVLVALLAEQRQLFAADRDAAGALLAVGEAKNDPALDPVELAAGAVLAEAILNHDEAVLRR